jgi:hypothetical protein
MKVKSIAFSFSFSQLVRAHSVLDNMFGLEHARVIIDAILDRSKSNLVLPTQHANRQVAIFQQFGKVKLDIKSSQPISIPDDVNEPQVINNTVHVSL